MWETNDTALFYALRGGGSAFGFIIDLKFKLYEDSVISQFTCTYYGVESEYLTNQDRHITRQTYY